MKIEVEIEEKERDEEYLEYVSSVSFDDCSREELEELGKFFLLAAKNLPPSRISKKEFRVNQMFLNSTSSRFRDHETHISVTLGMHEI